MIFFWELKSFVLKTYCYLSFLSLILKTFNEVLEILPRFRLFNLRKSLRDFIQSVSTHQWRTCKVLEFFLKSLKSASGSDLCPLENILEKCPKATKIHHITLAETCSWSDMRSSGESTSHPTRNILSSLPEQLVFRRIENSLLCRKDLELTLRATHFPPR